MIWSHSTRKHEQLIYQLDDLVLLQSVIPQHQVQLLNANFNDQLHYDNFAQLQSQIESILYTKSIEPELKNLLENYTRISLSYIQLVSMFKTSQKLLSVDQKKQHPQLSLLLSQIKVMLFDFITSPNKKIKSEIYILTSTIDKKIKDPSHLKYWQLFKLHLLYILDNYEKTAGYRQQLMNMSVTDKTISAIGQQHQKVDTAQYNRFISGFCSLLAIFMIFIIIMKRQQHTLQKTSKAHQNALKVKTQFLANMSHEIRTPMTGIIGLVELCLQTELNDEQRNYLGKVQFSATSLLTIINDILDFSKIESGQLAIESVPFEHHKVIDNINVMLGRIAEDKNIELIFDLDPKTPPVMIGDPVRLSQILLNLLSNAVKFTDVGHVILKSKLIKDDEDGEYSRISYQIEDTGIGLTPEQQSKLFKRFSQADESTTRKYGGTGLGLAICKLLVDIMKGEVGVTSQLGKGSIFNVSLPLIEGEKPEQLIVESLCDTKYKDIRLLLIEDNEITQCVISKMADYFGVEIDVTSTIGGAKSLCQKNKYDIALVDWNLKSESGLDFITDIIKQSYCPSLLVVCSAYSKSYIEQYSTFDFDVNYLAKPLTLMSLSKTLDLYLTPESGDIDNSNDIFHDNSDVKTSTTNKNLTDKQSQRPQLNPSPVNNYSETPASVDNCIDKQTVLLVEDNKINQLVATKLLENLGLKVDIAEDGRQAIESITAGNYSVVLMDIQMPVMDGIEATIELRKTYTHEQLQIIALTANVTSEAIDHYKEIGMNGHLGKPYEITRIQDVLEPYFDLSK
jgi:signal transduction histidine kinase/DNA-binding response OmpR family regulator